MEYINLAHDSHKSQAVVNMVMKICVPQYVGNFLAENYWFVKNESGPWSLLVSHFEFIHVI